MAPPLAVLLLVLSGALLAHTKSTGSLDEVSKDFTSANDVADYLAYLNQYFQSVSRPRFGKRAPGGYDFRSPADAAKYVTSLNQYLHSVSRPRFGKRNKSFDTPAAAAEYINNLNQYLHSMSRPRFGKRLYRLGGGGSVYDGVAAT